MIISIDTEKSFGKIQHPFMIKKKTTRQSTLSHEITYRVCISIAPTLIFLGFPCGSTGKESACNVGDLGMIPRLGRSPGEGKGYPLQCSGQENSMDCIVHAILQARILEWVAFPFSTGPSQPRDRIQVSRIAGRFFTS